MVEVLGGGHALGEHAAQVEDLGFHGGGELGRSGQQQPAAKEGLHDEKAHDEKEAKEQRLFPSPERPSTGLGFPWAARSR